ncbi:uncharacterized protein F13E9.13, mitochondrial-like isoform X2 [Acanthaster planci]|uniref:Uncharacterized protein F13E9.13, mitochondrial-like isoform X2 n=1 Tax=Acanthaster planci TaxID=133434 RepID=A0A8B7YI67_ACAPL|nr:uncharacterized protein F13E9.13, mitochondrial-like isoform X2 [Acanthaster planci]
MSLCVLWEVFPRSVIRGFFLEVTPILVGVKMSRNALSLFSQLFGRTHGVIIGMIHVKALPGSPRYRLPVKDIIRLACEEAEGYRQAGVDAIIIENMHDVPYLQADHLGSEVTASMTAVASKVREVCPSMPCGVQILSGANKEALSVAMVAGLDFIRAEGFVFSHVGDEGFLNSCAGELLRYRKNIGAEEVKIFTDIKKKHCSHAITADVSIAETASAAEFFGSDGVIVTGSVTGQEASVQEIKDVQASVDIPVLVGSGVTLSNVEQYLGASGLIVGSHFKHNGLWHYHPDFSNVKKFMDKVQNLRGDPAK